MPDPHAFTLVVRWLHVASMAVAVGGAVLLALFAVDAGAGDRQRALLAIATRYEWAFWFAVGLLAMTGVGNIAGFGTGLPQPTTMWGGILVAKLLSVGALAVLSVPRTLAIATLGTRPDLVSARGLSTLRGLYTATAVGLALILALAVWLSHG